MNLFLISFIIQGMAEHEFNIVKKNVGASPYSLILPLYKNRFELGRLNLDKVNTLRLNKLILDNVKKLPIRALNKGLKPSY